MNNKGINKRRHPRLYFKAADMLKLRIVCPRLNKTPFIVKVMNISESGLCFVMSQESNIKINECDQLVLEKIEGVQIFKAIITVVMTVRWTFREKGLDLQMYGCEFLNMPSTYITHLRTFIRSKSETRPKSPSRLHHI